MKALHLILILLCLGCYKKNEDIEALKIQDIQFKTTLKNHTPGVDYIIDKNLDVSKELIIEEGVEIIVEEGCGIVVKDSGSIHFNGSSTHPIVFKKKSKSGQWNGIIVSSPLDNQLRYVEISGAGQLGENHGAVEIRPFAQLSLSNCKISDNENVSGVLLSENAKYKLESCEISRNDYPLQMDLLADLQISNCNLKGNAHDMIRVCNQDRSVLIAKRELVIKPLGIPYYFTSSLLIAGYKVSINAGVTILFDRASGIATTLYNSTGVLLYAYGTSGQPITFGSFYNDENNLWGGVKLFTGICKFYNVKFNKAYTGSKEIGTLYVNGNTYLDCKYNTFYANDDFCNISLIGKHIAYNSDIKSSNVFKNSKIPCVVQ